MVSRKRSEARPPRHMFDAFCHSGMELESVFLERLGNGGSQMTISSPESDWPTGRCQTPVPSQLFLLNHHPTRTSFHGPFRVAHEFGTKLKMPSTMYCGGGEGGYAAIDYGPCFCRKRRARSGFRACPHGGRVSLRYRG